jgi:hypothetical protein
MSQDLYDMIDKLPSDNLEISQNEQIVIQNLYPNTMSIPKPPQLQMSKLPAKIHSQEQVPSPKQVSSPKQVLQVSPKKLPPTTTPMESQMSSEIVEEDLPEEEISNKSPSMIYPNLISTFIITILFIVFNLSITDKWLDKITTKYLTGSSIKILLFFLVILCLKFTNII